MACLVFFVIVGAVAAVLMIKTGAFKGVSFFGTEDKADALAKALGKKIEKVPAHYSVKDVNDKAS